MGTIYISYNLFWQFEFLFDIDLHFYLPDRFKFDNSKSWMTSKKLSYIIEVTSSEDEMQRLGNIHGQDTSTQL